MTLQAWAGTGNFLRHLSIAQSHRILERLLRVNQQRENVKPQCWNKYSGVIHGKEMSTQTAQAVTKETQMATLPTDLETPGEQSTEPLKSVTIEQQADGSFMVGEDSGQDVETSGEAEPGMTPAQTIDEALNMARQLLQDDGSQGPMKAMRADVAAETWPVKKPAKPMMGGM